MAAEQYSLIFAGRRCGEHAEKPLGFHLGLIDLPKPVKEKIVVGDRTVLRSELSFDEMRALQALWLKQGFITEPQILLNPDILASGLRAKKVSEPDNDCTVHVLEPSLTNSPVYRRPGNGSLLKLNQHAKPSANHSEPCATARWSVYQFGTFPLVAAAAWLTLTIQPYIIAVAQRMGITPSLQTALGILFLVLGLATLPKLLQPLLHLSLTMGNRRFEVFEKSVLILGKRHYRWTNQKTSGELISSSNHATLVSDKQLYEWSADFYAEESGGIASDDIKDNLQDNMTQGSAVESLQLLLKHAKSALSPKTNENDFADIDWSQQPASAVIDANGDVAALIYQSNVLAYRVVQSQRQNCVELHGFCLMLLRGGAL